MVAQDYDYEIVGTLADGTASTVRFRAATSDTFKYARATAPFRKEQLDTSQRAGDQSLTGWWTRGQLSFHKGAGLRFYEVTEEDQSLNRFSESDGLVVNKVGQVTLSDSNDGTATLFGDPLSSVAVGGTFYSADGAVVHRSTTFTSTPTTVTQATAGLGAIELIPTGDWHELFLLGINGSGDDVIERIGGSGASASTLVWTLQDRSWEDAWYVKERLLVQSYNAELMFLDTDGGIATASGIFYSGVSNDRKFRHVVDTPGAIVLARADSQIFAITVDTSGAVPTPSTPVQIAALPNDEAIVGLAYAVGMLVIHTTKGVRIGELSADSSSLIYGPLVFETDPEYRLDPINGIRMEALGTSVLVPTPGPNGPGVYEVDLAEMVSPLTPAWFKRWSYTESLPSQLINEAGVWVAGDSTTSVSVAFAFKDNWNSSATLVTTWSGSTSAAAGYLVTAQHRLGTLDPKVFYSATIRCDLDGGEISVYEERADGTRTVIGYLGNGETLATFPFATQTPVESMGLSFELYGGSAKPVLLGYQIKALPAPGRQRILRWPLVVSDVTTTRSGVAKGKAGSAWENWSLLEAMEEADALVTFTDHRTGETGEAYIESTEMESDTPSKNHIDGFGGVGYLTLRKIS